MDARPVIRDLSVRKGTGAWAMLGENLAPEYHVVTGVRRMTTQQADPLRAAGIEITEDVIDKNRWYAFWDAPLEIPRRRRPEGAAAEPAGLGGPRTASEIRRADATFSATSCRVRTDGASLEVSYPGLTLGIFAGELRFTVYRGTNLIRMDAVAKTSEKWVAYKYDAGLGGFSTALTPRVTWRDTGGHPQQYAGGVTNQAMVPLKAANRVLVAAGKNGSLAVFTPPHTYFFTREVDTNLGYVYPQGRRGPLRVRHPPGRARRCSSTSTTSRCSTHRPARSADGRLLLRWRRKRGGDPAGGARLHSRRYLQARQRLQDDGEPLPPAVHRARAGHEVFDSPIQDIAAMKALGLNIVGLSDFHGDLHANDAGAVRFQDQRDYGEATRRASDADFLVTPWEEPSAYFGGHYNILFPKNVYWTKVRKEGQPFTEQEDSVFGRVYHTGSAEDVQKMMDAEGAYWVSRASTDQGTTGYPDLIFDKAWTKNDRYLGVAFKPGMGMDLSEARMCEWRCFDVTDTMNNLYAGSGLRPSAHHRGHRHLSEGPEDDLYPNFPVNYLRLDKVPGPDDDWSPVLTACATATSS